MIAFQFQSMCRHAVLAGFARSFQIKRRNEARGTSDTKVSFLELLVSNYMFVSNQAHNFSKYGLSIGLMRRNAGNSCLLRVIENFGLG